MLTNTIDQNILRNDERIVLALRSLYAGYGYRQYRMSRFESYDLYVRNKDFLVSDRIITFTDTNGQLMALKPDVTLSIIKSTKDEPGTVQKLYYNENVYRASDDSHGFSEIMQAGLECIGDLTPAHISEVVRLAVQSLGAISKDHVLEISHLGIISSFIDSLEIPQEARTGLVRCINEKNVDTLDAICREENVASPLCDALKSLALLYARPEDAMLQLNELLASVESAISDNPELTSFAEQLASSVDELAGLISSLEDVDNIRIDFSVSSDMKYYNGIVFNGFIQGIPACVLSGGCYDRLMKKIGRRSHAIGFAVYLDVLERLGELNSKGYDFNAPEMSAEAQVSAGHLVSASSETSTPSIEFSGSGTGIIPSRKMLNVALPKGRLGENVYDMFAKAGFECPSIMENNRKLIFENPDAGVRYFWAKPSDVQIYVERGAADIGVAGKDIILEYAPDIYELLDLNIGKCRMCVAAPEGFRDDPNRTLRVATKFANIAKTYYSSVDRDIDIVHLNGSIEIAPILGLTDVIVDIVETGTTLRENHLEVIETIVPISARLIANKASYKFNSDVIMRITESLREMVKP